MAKKHDDIKKKKKPTREQEEQIVVDVFADTRKAFEKAGFTAEKIAEELALIGFADMADFVQVDEQGSVKPLSFDELKKNKSRIIKKIREKRRIINGDGEDTILEDTFEFELHDKLNALKEAILILGLKAPEKLEIKTDIAEELAKARLRAKERKT
jgi:hypothetical protein